MKCSSCGADVPSDSSVCQYCGSSVESDRKTTPDFLFDKVKRSPQYAERDTPERRARLPEFSGLAKAFPTIFATGFIAVSVMIVVGTLVMAGVMGLAGRMAGFPLASGLAIVPLLMAIVPIGFVVLGVYLFRHFRAKTLELEKAPILARAAIIICKRLHVSGGFGDSSASTRYFITAVFEDGAREELQAMTSQLYGQIAEDDAGVLFTRSMLALDFDRVET